MADIRITMSRTYVFSRWQCAATLLLLGFCSARLMAQDDVPSSDELRVMSFNVRYGTADDGPNHWEHRKPLVARVIRDFAADIVGTQETLQVQADYLLEQFPEYVYFGRSRMTTDDEQCGLFYRSARFEWLAGGHFWLSETPSEPASRSWDSSLPRMATWLLLRDKSHSRVLLVVNTHFDHQGQQARRESALLIAQQMRVLAQLDSTAHVIILGDFNTAAGSEPYQTLLSTMPGMIDTYRALHPKVAANEATFHGWQDVDQGSRIDWMLIGPTLDPRGAQIVRWSQDGRFPSDHFPVTAVLHYRVDSP